MLFIILCNFGGRVMNAFDIIEGGFRRPRRPRNFVFCRFFRFISIFLHSGIPRSKLVLSKTNKFQQLKMADASSSFLVIHDVIDLKIINFALANFLILSDNLVSIISIFHFISTLKESWIPPITSTI